MLLRSILRLVFVVAFVAGAVPAKAADIRVMISAGFFHVYSELGPAFEKATGHHLITTRGPSVGNSPEAIPARLSRGEDADVAIMDGSGVDFLVSAHLARAGSQIVLAESSFGMVVRAGQPKPDISTVDALAQRRCWRPNPSPIPTAAAARICRPSASRSSASPNRLRPSRTKCAGRRRASRWPRSSRAAEPKSAFSRSPNSSTCRAPISSAPCRPGYSRRLSSSAC